MKKLVKRMIPVALALAFCIGAVSMAACAQKDVVFTGSGNLMADFSITLTLKGDKTADFTFSFDGEKEPGGVLEQMEKGFCATGTYEFKDNKYTVTLGEGDKKQTLTSTYDEATKTYTIPYELQGRDGKVTINLTYKA